MLILMIMDRPDSTRFQKNELKALIELHEIQKYATRDGRGTQDSLKQNLI
ncbi:unnamed protein product [Paramecium sonneborni]|nr:unnamed protein product [Paramecium sonneborni]